MTPPTTTTSANADSSVRLLMTTLAQHRRQEALLATSTPPLGRLSVLPSGARSVQVRRQAAVMRIASVVEAYVAGELVSRIEPHAPKPRSSILDDIYTRAEDSALASWPTLQEHYTRWLEIKIGTSPSWRRIEATTNVRNAIAHGLGELTRRMARKNLSQLQKDFATIDVQIVGSALVLSEEALWRSAFAAREFISWLDGELANYDLHLAALA